MDRRLKERLVGASILVALIVVVVPELLSGPKPRTAAPAPAIAAAPMRTVTVDLATRKTVGAAESGVAGTESGQPPSPPSGNPAGAAPGGPAQPAGGAPAGASSPAASAAPAAPNARGPGAQPLESSAPAPTSEVKKASPPAGGAPRAGSWAVQLGSFVDKANAEKLVRQLKSSGIAVYVVKTGSGGSQRYRVRMGPMSDRAAAERAAAKLNAQGHATTLVSPVS